MNFHVRYQNQCCTFPLKGIINSREVLCNYIQVFWVAFKLICLSFLWLCRIKDKFLCSKTLNKCNHLTSLNLSRTNVSNKGNNDNNMYLYSAVSAKLVLKAHSIIYPCSSDSLIIPENHLISAHIGLIKHNNQLCPRRYPFTPGWREAITVKVSCSRTQAPWSRSGFEPTCWRLGHQNTNPMH